MSFFKNIDLTIDSEYLKKAIELNNIKENFEKWGQVVKDIDFLPLIESIELINKYEINFPRILMPNISHPMTFYRARVISPSSIEDITNPKTFSYPPKEKIDYYQRANVPGHPVFYGAFDGMTALEELRFNGNEPIKKGDIVYLSEWKIKENVKYNFNYLTLSHIVKEDNLFADITKRVYSEFKRIFKNEDLFFMNKQIYLFNKASQLFLAENYIQSGTIAYQILYNTPEVSGIKIDGILYPSCSNDFRSVNCALHPDFVDSKMELLNVRKISFDDFTEEGAKSTMYYVGFQKNDKINWQKYITELIISDYSVTLELSSIWTNEDVESAKSFFNRKEFNLRSICEDYIRSIDLSNHKLDKKQEDMYRSNSKMLFRKQILFDEKTCYLMKGDEINYIKSINIEIPAIGRIEKAAIRLVKKNKYSAKIKIVPSKNPKPNIRNSESKLPSI